MNKPASWHPETHHAAPAKRKPGRPAHKPSEARTGRLSLRVRPEVEAKAAKVGRAAVERAIMRIREPAPMVAGKNELVGRGIICHDGRVIFLGTE